MRRRAHSVVSATVGGASVPFSFAAAPAAARSRALSGNPTTRWAFDKRGGTVTREEVSSAAHPVAYVFHPCLLHRLAAIDHFGGRLDGPSLEDLTDACAFAAHVAALTCSAPGANRPARTRQRGRGSAESRCRRAAVPHLNAVTSVRALSAATRDTVISSAGSVPRR